MGKKGRKVCEQEYAIPSRSRWRPKLVPAASIEAKRFLGNMTAPQKLPPYNHLKHVRVVREPISLTTVPRSHFHRGNNLRGDPRALSTVDPQLPLAPAAGSAATSLTAVRATTSTAAIRSRLQRQASAPPPPTAVRNYMCPRQSRAAASMEAMSSRPSSYRLALLKSTLRDTSPDLGTLEFVPLSGEETVC